jgi:hypothetical protein
MGGRAIKIAAAVAVLAALVGGGVAWATAGGDEQPLTGSALERATEAALRHTGGGTVTETEVGDDRAAYSVEVRLEDGSQVEVNLDENFEVMGQESDDDRANDEDETGESE